MSDHQDAHELHDRQQHLFAQRVAAFDDEYPGYSARWDELTRIVLACAGRLVVAPMQPEDDIVRLIADGRHADDVTAFAVGGGRCDCHANAARLWRNRNAERHDVVAIGTGYALSDDGLWRQHSWTVTSTGAVIETTEPRERYFGLTLTGQDAATFAAEQGIY